MSSKPVTEKEIRKRLKDASKSKKEIDKLLNDYAGLISEHTIDRGAINDLLQKSEEESVLRVSGFRLKREQFDALHNYFDEEGKLVGQQNINANRLINYALEDFLNLIS